MEQYPTRPSQTNVSGPESTRDDVMATVKFEVAGILISSVGVSSASPIEWHQVVKLLAACTVTVDQVVDVVAYAPTFRAPTELYVNT